jgi:NADPH:quinone reductase-like Zn-dependent oxidoreductase
MLSSRLTVCSADYKPQAPAAKGWAVSSRTNKTGGAIMLALYAAPGTEQAVELREAQDPTPAPDEALVRVRATSLNLGETRRTKLAKEAWRPGWDIAGEVLIPAENGSGPATGIRVVGLVRSGAWAEKAAVPTRWLAPIPDNVSYTEASTLPVAGLTALKALAVGGLLVGKDVLVTGASGGVGQFGVQLAAIAGARVTAVVSRPERAEGAAKLGASEVLVGLEMTGPTYDLILESLAGPVLAASIMRLRMAGTIVSFGSSSREPSTFNLNDLSGQLGSRTLCYKFSLFEELERQPSGDRDLATLARLIGDGKLDPQVGLEVSWRDAATAVQALLERQVRGKAVLTID